MLKEGALFYTERFTLIYSFLETTAVKNNSKYFSHSVSLSYLLDYITNHILNQIKKYQVRRHGSSANYSSLIFMNLLELAPIFPPVKWNKNTCCSYLTVGYWEETTAPGDFNNLF